MKQEAKTNRSLLVLLVMILAIGLTMGLNTKNTYASSNPTLTMGNQGVLFLNTDGCYDVRTIKLHNLPEDVISISWKSDKPKIASVDKENKASTYVRGENPGTAKITATITYWADVIDEDGDEDVVEKTCTATKTVIVKKANGIKSLKIGTASAKSLNTYVGQGHIYNNEKGKLKISMNKGWKLSSIVFKDGKTKKTIKNGSMINSKKKSATLYVTVKDSKTSASYKTEIPVQKYDIWKITYGKMKKNTCLGSEIVLASGISNPAWQQYSKKAKKDDYGSFKNVQDLTNKLSEYDAKRNGNVITLKVLCNKGYPKTFIYWENPGKGCKVQYIKKVK